MGWAARAAGLAIVVAVPMAGAGAAEDNSFDCVIQPRTIANIGSADQGIIDKILVERGDIVKEGQVLARLDSRIELLNAKLAKLQANQDVDLRSKKAKLNFQRLVKERAETLFDRKAGTQKDLQQAEVDLAVAQLDVETAELNHQVAEAQYALAEAQVDRRTIRSPMNGVVTEVKLWPGEYVNEQTPLLTVARVDELNVEVYVPVPKYGEINAGQDAVVMPIEPIGGTYRAVVSVVDRVFDAASNTFGVRLRLDNKGYALPAGVKCKVRFAMRRAGLGRAPRAHDGGGGVAGSHGIE